MGGERLGRFRLQGGDSIKTESSGVRGKKACGLDWKVRQKGQDNLTAMKTGVPHQFEIPRTRA
jgi:hypothetical protein